MTKFKIKKDQKKVSVRKNGSGQNVTIKTQIIMI